jgi:hypothetical protein
MKKKMEKTKPINIAPYFWTAVILLYVGIFFSGITQIYNGFHTFDMGQNFEYIAYEEDIDLSHYYETTSSGNTLTIISMYRQGLNQCIKGLSLLILDSGIALVYILTWRPD